MIKLMFYELDHQLIECLYDGVDTWFVINRGHPIYCQSFQEASLRMDEAIEELRKEVPSER